MAQPLFILGLAVKLQASPQIRKVLILTLGALSGSVLLAFLGSVAQPGGLLYGLLLVCGCAIASLAMIVVLDWADNRWPQRSDFADVGRSASVEARDRPSPVGLTK